jgi:hypothetical protein
MRSEILRRMGGSFFELASARIRQNRAWSILMMDIVMVALAVGFFAVSIAYVYACAQL